MISLSTEILYRLMAGQATAARHITIEGNAMVTRSAVESLRGVLDGTALDGRGQRRPQRAGVSRPSRS